MTTTEMKLVRYGCDGYKTEDGRFTVAKNYAGAKWYAELGWVLFDGGEIIGYPKSLRNAKVRIARRLAS